MKSTCTGVLRQMIQEARARKGDLTVIWLDLANAYGSMPHNLIRTALKHNHIPEHVLWMIAGFLDGIILQFKTEDYSTHGQPLERGFVTGCTVSPILCVIGMNFIRKSGEKVTSGPMMELRIWQPTMSHRQCARNFTIRKQAMNRPERIERSSLPGKFKSWLYQHGLLPRLLQLMTVFVPLLMGFQRVERKVCTHFRRWLVISPSVTSIGLYIRSGQLQLPLSPLVEEF